MKVIKKNQIIIFILAFMLVTAGYVNYNKTIDNTVETSALMDSEQIAGIGDAQLVNSNNIVDDESNKEVLNNEQPSIETNAKLSETGNQAYFTNSKLERDKMYSQMLETYQKILENLSISEAQKSIAQTELAKIQNTKNCIMISENLIKNKGFNDVIIFVNDNSISVIIDKKNLEEAEIAQVQNIIIRELGVSADQIHISTK